MKKKLSVLLVSLLMTVATASQAVILDGNYNYDNASGTNSVALAFNLDILDSLITPGSTATFVDLLDSTNLTITRADTVVVDLTAYSTSLSLSINADGSLNRWFIDLLDPAGTPVYMFDAFSASLDPNDPTPYAARIGSSASLVYPAPAPTDSAANVPEPGALGLLAIGLLGLGFARRRQNKLAV